MWFKNLQLYRLHDSTPLDDGRLAECLPEYRFRPVSGVEAKRIGWVPPAGRDSDALVHEVSGHYLISALYQDRILPSSVIKDELDERVAEREATEGRPLRRREKLTLKEQIYEELLPRAFTRSKRTDLWWSRRSGLIAINASTAKRAEEVLDLLRHTLGSLKVTPLAVAQPPSQVMTTWLKDVSSRPEGLIVGDAVTLTAPGGEDGVLRARLYDLDGEEIQTALSLGRIVSQMSVELDGKVAMMLCDDMSLKQLHFADAIIDEANAQDDDEDPVLRLEADFALMAGLLDQVASDLISWMGGEAQPAT
ncbi:recombination-associated protein RdgC [Cobetia sp. MC34]|uniref:recombination-associated protein RdgC n=1 Tax=Cobetia sp. MC34 TaxID=2785080 RepID=UPI001BCA0623|nr:recombination-associated protein RdgC [Cobetia sp. MC34]MBS4155391.1 recombination-associated protein RdgC [Cobetia sp. MC34]